MSVYAAGFPDNPSKGQTHTHNGVTYKYNGEAWDIVSHSNEGGGGDPGGGGGGGGDCSECIDYVDEKVGEEATARDEQITGEVGKLEDLIKEEAAERLKGDEELQHEIGDEAKIREEEDHDLKERLNDVEAALETLGSIDGPDGEIHLDAYATKAALQEEEDARILGDETLQSEITNLDDALDQFKETVDAKFDEVVTQEWATDTFLPLDGGTLTGSLTTGGLFKTTRESGNKYAFEIKPEDVSTVAYIKTNGNASFTSVKVDGTELAKENHTHDGYATQEWVYQNTADPDDVAAADHLHDSRYSKIDHTHDDLDISSQLGDYAKGPGIVFRKQSGNLYVSWS